MGALWPGEVVDVGCNHAVPHAIHYWYENDLVEVRRADIARDSAQAILHDEVDRVFGHVLEDAGVFKWDYAGRAALDRFLATL